MDNTTTIADAWLERAAGAHPARFHHTAVWTGSEMIIWGGTPGVNGPYLNTGGRYNLASNTWTTMSIAGAPKPRTWHSAVWTGSEMIVDSSPLSPAEAC